MQSPDKHMTENEFVARLPMNAETIASLTVEEPDTYVVRIVHAARVLVHQGRGRYVYQTSWSSGATHWKFEQEDTVVPASRTVEEVTDGS